MQVFKILFVLLASAPLVLCYCPPDKMHVVGHCRYRVHCTGAIRGFRLSNECLGSPNFPVTVDVTLTNAIERFDDNLDIDMLGYITTLRISARWKETELSILQYTPKLQKLNISNNGIEKINGVPFEHLNHLENLDLSGNKLTEVENLFQFEEPNRLTRLSLACNAIQDLPSYAFDELASLVELDLSYNLISELNEEPFYNLTRLVTLRLNNNRIVNLNGALNNMQILKHLYLKGNKIDNIDERSVKVIMDLETFDLSGNHLQQIKPVMLSRHWEHFENHSVCKILLSDNNIVEVPNGTSEEVTSRFARHLDVNTVEILTEVDLSKNSISKIAYNAFHSLVQLVSLDLSNNKITDFIVNAEDLACLRYLNLSSNYISRLYFESFSSMTHLQNLDLSYNRLDYIPDKTFNNNYNLKLVNMTFNEIEQLEHININMFHPSGGVLDLSNNELFKITIPFHEGIRLFTLMLRSNNISDAGLVNLPLQSDLKNLDLSKNLIKKLNYSMLHLPSSLVYLDMSYNKIREIGPSSFHDLSEVKKLRLGHNALTKLEYGMFQGLSALTDLDLSYNMIHYLDSKLLMDLKSLQFLSIRSNDMITLDYRYWYGHKFDVTVHVDNNNFTCEWLASALNDYTNGYSRMKPTVFIRTAGVNTLDGIPCNAEAPMAYTKANIMVDDRLLVITQKILEAVKEQNYFLRRFAFRAIEEARKSTNESN